jgi:hypothetical protein
MGDLEQLEVVLEDGQMRLRLADADSWLFTQGPDWLLVQTLPIYVVVGVTAEDSCTLHQVKQGLADFVNQLKVFVENVGVTAHAEEEVTAFENELMDLSVSLHAVSVDEVVALVVLNAKLTAQPVGKEDHLGTVSLHSAG